MGYWELDISSIHVIFGGITGYTMERHKPFLTLQYSDSLITQKIDLRQSEIL